MKTTACILFSLIGFLNLQACNSIIKNPDESPPLKEETIKDNFASGSHQTEQRKDTETEEDGTISILVLGDSEISEIEDVVRFLCENGYLHGYMIGSIFGVGSEYEVMAVDEIYTVTKKENAWHVSVSNWQSHRKITINNGEYPKEPIRERMIKIPVCNDSQ